MSLPRRMLDFNQIADGVVDGHGRRHGWMTTEGLKATPQYDGYVRYFRFCANDGIVRSSDLALYVSCNQWVKTGITPLWLRIGSSKTVEVEAMLNQSEVEYVWSPGDHVWIPLQLRTGVEFGDVLEGVVSQLERVRDIVLPAVAKAETAKSAADDDALGDAGLGQQAVE